VDLTAGRLPPADTVPAVTGDLHELLADLVAMTLPGRTDFSGPG
jgi:hypothetical protein